MPEGISSLNVGLGTNTTDTIRLTFRGRVIFLVRKWRQLSLSHLNCSHYVLEKLQGFKCYNYSVLFSLLSTAVPQTLPHPSLKLLLKTMLFNFWLEFPSLKEIYTIYLKPSSFDFYFSVLLGQLPSTDGNAVPFKGCICHGTCWHHFFPFHVESHTFLPMACSSRTLNYT